MTGGQVMVVLIVAIVMLASIIKGRMGISSGRGRGRHGGEERIGSGESARLQEEVVRLKERIAVLERIATDKNHLLEEEFERLRNR